MSDRKMTQWEYALMLLPYDAKMTQGELEAMPRGALFMWIERTKAIRHDALKEENEALKREYNELIEEQKDKLLKVAEGMTTLEKAGHFEWKGPCPLCANGGHDRFHVNIRGVPWWYCRQCTEGGDTVSLVAKKNGLTMWEAAEELAGWSPRDRAEVNRQRKYNIVQQSNKPKDLTDFTAKFDTCRQTFSENSLTAMTYFGKRRLDKRTISKNRVGMTQTVRGLSIAYPCEQLVDGGWQIVGINRRYLDAEHVKEMIEKAKTFDSKKKIKRDNPKTKLSYGGNWGVYRLRRTKGAVGLLIVEGEENSLSVWQAARASGWPCDVVSVGCQSNFKSLKADIKALASDYQHLLSWADEQHMADEALGFYGHASALAVSSPILAGYDKPADANAMLMQGDLLVFLAHQLKRLSADLVTANQPDAPMPTTPANGQVPTHLPTDLPAEGDGQAANQPDAPTNPPTGTPANSEEMALWARYASEMEEEDDDSEAGLSHVIASAWWAECDGRDWMDTPDAHALPTNAPIMHMAHTNGAQVIPSDAQPLPTTRPTDAQPTHTAHATASDELLALCAALCSQVADKQKARRWYLVAERHYMYGDATSLHECYQAISSVMGYQVEPSFPALPPVSPVSPSEFDQPSAYHEWVWAARAVQRGDTGYEGQAWAWARKIEDEELRGEALREMGKLTGGSVGKQLALLEA